MRGGVFGYVEVHDFAMIMVENDEHIENTKRGSWHGEEINRGEVRYMII
jgi:hypothetical protein